MSTNTTNSGKTVKSAGWLINLISFVAVILIGLALILSKLGILGSISSSVMIIAQTIAYFVVSVVSFFYVYRSKKVWVWIAWIIAVALIIVSYIIV